LYRLRFAGPSTIDFDQRPANAHWPIDFTGTNNVTAVTADGSRPASSGDRD
jgi:hypothetical protein